MVCHSAQVSAVMPAMPRAKRGQSSCRGSGREVDPGRSISNRGPKHTPPIGNNLHIGIIIALLALFLPDHLCVDTFTRAIPSFSELGHTWAARTTSLRPKQPTASRFVRYLTPRSLHAAPAPGHVARLGLLIDTPNNKDKCTPRRSSPSHHLSLSLSLPDLCLKF